MDTWILQGESGWIHGYLRAVCYASKCLYLSNRPHSLVNRVHHDPLVQLPLYLLFSLPVGPFNLSSSALGLLLGKSRR